MTITLDEIPEELVAQLLEDLLKKRLQGNNNGSANTNKSASQIQYTSSSETASTDATTNKKDADSSHSDDMDQDKTAVCNSIKTKQRYVIQQLFIQLLCCTFSFSSSSSSSSFNSLHRSADTVPLLPRTNSLSLFHFLLLIILFFFKHCLLFAHLQESVSARKKTQRSTNIRDRGNYY
jgi:hypothetical protein